MHHAKVKKACVYSQQTSAMVFGICSGAEQRCSFGAYIASVQHKLLTGVRVAGHVLNMGSIYICNEG